jgi:hypothetical protein
MQQAITTTDKEKKMIEERAKNIIIYRAPESNKTDRRTCEQHDRKFVNELCKEIGIDNIEVEEVIRLGRKETDKVRPLRVCVKDIEHKTKVMKSLRNLRDASEKFIEVSVTHDLTEEQKELKNKLLKEAKEKTEAEGEGTHYFRLVSNPGPQWDPKIIRTKVRLKRNNQQNANTMKQAEEMEAKIAAEVDRRLVEARKSQMQENLQEEEGHQQTAGSHQ